MESLWAGFAEAALAFPRLEYVKLHLEWDWRPKSAPASLFHEPAPLGITDEAFKPLIAAGKFRCEVRGYRGETTLTATSTVDPRPRAGQEDEVSSTAGVGSLTAEPAEDEGRGRVIESEDAEGHNNRKCHLSAPTLVDANLAVHWKWAPFHLLSGMLNKITRRELLDSES